MKPVKTKSVAPSSRRSGWLPDLPDPRDHLFAVSAATATRLPASRDLASDFWTLRLVEE